MLYSGSAKNNDYVLTIKNYSGLKNLMKSGKPGLVVAALIYFSIISALAAAATFYLLIFGDDLRLFSVLSIMALLPNLIGVIVLMKEPRPVYHTYCSILGNITAFGSLFLNVVIMLNSDFVFKNTTVIIISILLIYLFLKFDFSHDNRIYFRKVRTRSKWFLIPVKGKDRENPGSDENSSLKEWENFSMDFKLIFVYHGFIMALLLISRIVPVEIQLAFVVLLFLILVYRSVKHRIENRWSWPGLEIKKIPFTVFSASMVLFFFLQNYNSSPPSDPTFFPWYAAGLVMFFYTVMIGLNISTLSRKTFESQCEGRKVVVKPELQREEGIILEKLIIKIYHLASTSVIIMMIAYAWLSDRSTVEDRNSGVTKAIIDSLEFLAGFIGKSIDKGPEKFFEGILLYWAPVVIAAGFIIHYILGIKVFGDSPTLKELMNKFINWRKSGSRR